jgi:hypothetical protein
MKMSQEEYFKKKTGMDITYSHTWNEITDKRNEKSYWVFQLGEEPELIHVIKTGFDDEYMVVSEQAYGGSGDVNFYTKAKLEDTYKVKL